jgi:hypothetical protein
VSQHEQLGILGGAPGAVVPLARTAVPYPVRVGDEYDNPVPRLEHPGTAHRTIAGLIQPTGSTPNLEPGRTTLVTTWRLFTTSPATARDRILWQGRIFQVTGQPSQWSRSGQPSQWR